LTKVASAWDILKGLVPIKIYNTINCTLYEIKFKVSLFYREDAEAEMMKQDVDRVDKVTRDHGCEKDAVSFLTLIGRISLKVCVFSICVEKMIK